MFDSPQTFASKAAILDVLKRASATPLTRDELVHAVSRELSLAPPPAEEVLQALDELKLDAQLQSEIVDGVEKFRFDESPE